MTKNLVAICDVLGFKDILEDARLEELRQTYESLIDNTKIVVEELSITSLMEGFHGHKELSEIHHAVFSDTILLWSSNIEEGDNESVLVAEKFLSAICYLIGIGLRRDFPLRCGIAFGEFYSDKQRGIYLGKSIVDAYETEQRQEWVGAACHPSCLNIERFTLLESGGFHRGLGRHVDVGALVRCEIPVKRPQRRRDGTYPPRLEMSINWPSYNAPDVKAKLIEGYRKYRGQDERVINKWKNALEYYDDIQPFLEDVVGRLEWRE